MIYRPQSLPLASPCAELTSSVKPKECGVILTCRPSVLVDESYPVWNGLLKLACGQSCMAHGP